jgi:hypothetical protein
MKHLFILSTFLIHLSFVKPTTISSNYAIVKNSGLGSSYDTNTISQFTNKASMLMCIIECNRIQSCTVAIYAEDSQICQIYSVINFIFEENSNKVAGIKTDSNLNTGIYTNSTSASITQSTSTSTTTSNSIATTPNTTTQSSSNKTVDSLILTSAEVQKIYELGGYSPAQGFQLLYRATRDGFSTASFHSKCDAFLNTLIIVKSSNAYVFGGFTTQSWANCQLNCWKTDHSAFILSLRRNVAGFNAVTDARRFNVTNPSKAIDPSSLYGPNFGDDFYIRDMSNINNDSNSKFGQSYQFPSEFTAMSFDASNYLTGCIDISGTCRFSTVEIEVYKLL